MPRPGEQRRDADEVGILIRPLTKAAFRPFGEVLEIEGAETRIINSGTCKRFHSLAAVDIHGENAKTIVSLFRAEPVRFPLHLLMMERHPLGSQAFWPLSGGEWLIAVASDHDGIPGTPQVFRATGRQGVCYTPNVWHHPLLALDAVADFLVVDREGPGKNLEELSYRTPYAVQVISEALR